MMSNYRDILQKYWGYDDFRGVQRPIIESIGSGHDTLGLMPTGGGKSITFQVPALAMEGVCIVITPLIALMKDQVQHLRRLGIRAEAIYSGMQHDEILRILENCVFEDDADLAFEYSDVEASIIGPVPSVKNPRSGRINADSYGAIILDGNIKAPADCEIRTWAEPDVDLAANPDIVEY